MEAFCERRSNGQLIEFFRGLRFKIAAYEPLYHSEVMASRDRRIQQQKDRQRFRRASVVAKPVNEFEATERHGTTSNSGAANQPLAEAREISKTPRRVSIAGYGPVGTSASDTRSMTSGDSVMSRSSMRSTLSRLSTRTSKSKVKVPKSAKRMDTMYEQLTDQLYSDLASLKQESDAREHRSRQFDQRVDAVRRKNKEDLRRTEEVIARLRAKPTNASGAPEPSFLEEDEEVLRERNRVLETLIEEAKAEVNPAFCEDEFDSDEDSDEWEREGSGGHLQQQENMATSPKPPGSDYVQDVMRLALERMSFASDASGAEYDGANEIEQQLVTEPGEDSDEDSEEDDPPPPPPSAPPPHLLNRIQQEAGSVGLEAAVHGGETIEDGTELAFSEGLPAVQWWRQVFDESHQAYYYEDLHGGESTWDPPTSGVIECRDETEGQDYFLVVHSGESFWEMREAVAAATANPVTTEYNSPLPDQVAQSPSSLPPAEEEYAGDYDPEYPTQDVVQGAPLDHNVDHVHETETIVAAVENPVTTEYNSAPPELAAQSPTSLPFAEEEGAGGHYPECPTQDEMQGIPLDDEEDHDQLHQALDGNAGSFGGQAQPVQPSVPGSSSPSTLHPPLPPQNVNQAVVKDGTEQDDLSSDDEYVYDEAMGKITPPVPPPTQPPGTPPTQPPESPECTLS